MKPKLHKMNSLRSKLRTLFLFLAGILLSMQLSAQRRAVTGTILESDGVTPLIGATVKVKGSTSGAISDRDGKFHLNVEGNKNVLSITYMGYDPQEITVGNRSVIQAIMKESAVALNETVVTALGITREQKSLGYAVSKLGEEEVTSSL